MAQSPDPGGFRPFEVPVTDHTAAPGFAPIEVERAPRVAATTRAKSKPPRAHATTARPSKPKTDAPAPTPDTAAPAEKQEA